VNTNQIGRSYINGYQNNPSRKAYDRLKAEMRESESFSDTVKRITGEVATDWQYSIGTYSGEQSNEFANAVQRRHESINYGFAQRQRYYSRR
jgi:predicted CopG family antitoxin